MAKDLTPEQIAEMLDTLRCPFCNEYVDCHDARITPWKHCEYREDYLTWTFNLAYAERELYSD